MILFSPIWNEIYIACTDSGLHISLPQVLRIVGMIISKVKSHYRTGIFCSSDMHTALFEN